MTQHEEYNQDQVHEALRDMKGERGACLSQRTTGPLFRSLQGVQDHYHKITARVDSI